MQSVAAVTKVRDDAFFLNAWLRHYGGQFGRENCSVINHGRGADVAKLAARCNVIGVPGDAHKNFDNYSAAMDRHHAVTADVGAGIKDAAIGRHWFGEERGEDRAAFEMFQTLEMMEEFDMRPLRRKMQRTFKPRGETGFYQFDRPDYAT